MDEGIADSNLADVQMSVVIPTHTGRGKLVGEMLQQLRDQVAGGLIEILVVDSSHGQEALVLEQVCESMPGCRYLRGPTDAAGKRNIGGSEAAGALLLFVDSDCLLPAESIHAHLAFMAAAPGHVGAALGATRMIDRGDVHPWTVAHHSHMYNQCYDWSDRYVRVLWGTTSNLIVRHEAFLKVGGFRAMYPAPVGGEDVDFGVRLTEVGFDIATNPAAVVYHRRAHIRDLYPIARSLFYYGAADAALVDLHPRRTQPHQPARLAGALLLGAVFAGGGRRMRATVALGTVAWAVARVGRNGGSMYGVTDERSAPAPRSELPRWLAARCLDATFTLGVIVGAFRRGKPALAIRRFVYVDHPGFVVRKAADDPLSTGTTPAAESAGTETATRRVA